MGISVTSHGSAPRTHKSVSPRSRHSVKYRTGPVNQSGPDIRRSPCAFSSSQQTIRELIKRNESRPIEKPRAREKRSRVHAVVSVLVAIAATYIRAHRSFQKSFHRSCRFFARLVPLLLAIRPRETRRHHGSHNILCPVWPRRETRRERRREREGGRAPN